MSDERWQRVEELFAAAVDLPPEDQRRLLARECGDDEALLREVEELLAAETGGDLVAEVVESAAVQAVEDRDALDPGRRLGPWLVEERLGEGGRSVVYWARRADRRFKKEVALKVLKRGMDSDDILRRFATERAILARLDHPKIARLLDAGTVEDSGGRPYFVMELVDGLPIDVYCGRRRLGIDRRLEIFGRVCEAVAYAHRNLVVHRDLKPSNILVSEAGEPKLLDFGIAKLLDPELAPGTGETTIAPLRLLTPGYASPKQIAGEAMTTASDVYSLGVVLYQLLCGRHPHLRPGRSPREVERAVREESPRSPSATLLQAPAAGPSSQEVAERRALNPGELARRLRGDLDAVVLQALRKPAEARYRSVEQLAEDLDRHRRRQPVSARRGTLRYRAGLFLRRHCLGVALAGAAALVLAVLFSALVVLSLRLEREREASERRWRLAEEVKEFLIDLFPVAGPEGTEARLTVGELLEHGTERTQRDDGEAPEVQAARLDTVGRVYQRLSLYREAEPLLAESLALYRRSAGRESTEYADGLNRLAILWVQQGAYARAEPPFRETLELRRRLFGPRNPAIAASLNNLALLLHDRGDYAAAEPLYRQAAAMDEALDGPEAPSTLTDKANLGLLLHDLGDYGSSETLLREVLAGREALYGPYREEIADTLTHLAMVLTAEGRHGEAAVLLRRALDIAEEAIGSEHPETARVIAALAGLERARGKLEEAERHYRQALELRRARLGEEHPEVATNLTALAETLSRAGRAGEAEPLFEQALGIHRRTLRGDHPEAAEAMAGLGRLRLEASDAAGAEPLLREAAAIFGRRQPAAPRAPARSSPGRRRCSRRSTAATTASPPGPASCATC